MVTRNNKFIILMSLLASLIAGYSYANYAPLRKTITIKRINQEPPITQDYQENLDNLDNNICIQKVAQENDTDQVDKEKKSSQEEITFAIIKPDAVRHGYTGEIIKLIELNKFDIVGMHKIKLNRHQASRFYREHKDKLFFNSLVNYMISGPIVVMALKKENAIKYWRDLMGATNPEKASVGSLRAMFGSSLTENAVHGSDSQKSAQRELQFFF